MNKREPLSAVGAASAFMALDLVFAGTAPKEPLPQVDKLSPAAQLKAEDQYNRRRINYSRQNPNL